MKKTVLTLVLSIFLTGISCANPLVKQNIEVYDNTITTERAKKDD